MQKPLVDTSSIIVLIVIAVALVALRIAPDVQYRAVIQSPKYEPPASTPALYVRQLPTLIPTPITSTYNAPASTAAPAADHRICVFVVNCN